MQIFKKDGMLHWLVQRFSAGFMLFMVILCFNNVFCFVLSFIILSFHVFAGLSTLLDDYVHDSDLIFCGFLYLRIFILFLFKTTFILII